MTNSGDTSRVHTVAPETRPLHIYFYLKCQVPPGSLSGVTSLRPLLPRHVVGLNLSPQFLRFLSIDNL